MIVWGRFIDLCVDLIPLVIHVLKYLSITHEFVHFSCTAHRSNGMQFIVKYPCIPQTH